MKHTTIIAELGINHNGDLLIAKQMIMAAKAAGADLVKFQKRTIDKVYSKAELDKPRESPWGTTNRVQKEGLEFDLDEYKEIDRYCKELEIDWIASCWDLESFKFIQQFNCPYNKVASAMLGHTELLNAIADEGKETFIATGMSVLSEISLAVDLFEAKKCPYILMHCNSQYPMPDERANLSLIPFYKKEYECEVGWSGHEVGIITSVAAVCYGATVIERHLTLDRSMYGSDQAASIEPQGFSKMVEYIRVVEKVGGHALKTISRAEQACRDKLRRTEDV